MIITHELTEEQIFRELSERAKQRRLASDITQKELAELSGVSTATIARFENGYDISVVKFIKILKALEVDKNAEMLIPDEKLRPSYYFEHRDRKRRARRKKLSEGDGQPWIWGEDK